MNNVYALKDGSLSSQYQVGDRFMVESTNIFTKGSVVEFEMDDHSDSPLFKLIEGKCGWNNAEGGLPGGYTPWAQLSPLEADYPYKYEGFYEPMELVYELARELLNEGLPVRADIYAKLLDAGYDLSGETDEH